MTGGSWRNLVNSITSSRSISTIGVSLIIFICSCMGCFPSCSPNINSKNFKFRWCHPVTLYSLALLGLNIFLGLDYLLHGVHHFVELIFGTGLAATINGYVQNYNLVINNLLLRTVAILYCGKSIRIIKIIRKLHLSSELLSAGIPENIRGGGGGGKGKVPIEKNGASVEKKDLAAEHDEDDEAEQDEETSMFNPRALNLYVVAVFFFQGVNYCARINPILAQQSSFDPTNMYKSLPRVEWLIRLCWSFFSGLENYSHFYALLAPVLVGVEIAVLYRSYKRILISHLKEPHFVGGYLEGFCKRFVKDFKLLMKAYSLFSDIATYYILISTFVATVAMAQFGYHFIISKNFASLSNAVSCFYWIYINSVLGNCLETDIRKGREELRNLMILESGREIDDNLKEVTTWMSGWKWKLTPFNLFTMNNRIIPAALGAVLTQVIFLFQLRMSTEL